MLRIGALASHGGSILQAVMDAISRQELNAEIVLLGSNNSKAEVINRARKHGIPTVHLSSIHHRSPEQLDRQMADKFLRAKADILLLAGYMRKIGPITLSAFQNRVINTHPSLLPKYGGKGFFGRKIHQAVIASRDTKTGVTIHLVDASYDTGSILDQIEIPVDKTDTPYTLEEKVKEHERTFIVSWLAQAARRETNLLF